MAVVATVQVLCDFFGGAVILMVVKLHIKVKVRDVQHQSESRGWKSA